MNSRPVKRIEDVSRLRTAQFTEDAGAMAHPIRPDSYIKMDNFYTLTVYEKGAEIVRLYRTLLGKDGFRCAVPSGMILMHGLSLRLLMSPCCCLLLFVPLLEVGNVQQAGLMLLEMGSSEHLKVTRHCAGRAWTCTSSATTGRQ